MIPMRWIAAQSETRSPDIAHLIIDVGFLNQADLTINVRRGSRAAGPSTDAHRRSAFNCGKPLSVRKVATQAYMAMAPPSTWISEPVM